MLTPKDVQQAAKLMLVGNEFLAIQMPENTKGGKGEEPKKGF
jgi:zinc protease